MHDCSYQASRAALGRCLTAQKYTDHNSIHLGFTITSLYPAQQLINAHFARVTTAVYHASPAVTICY